VEGIVEGSGRKSVGSRAATCDIYHFQINIISRKSCLPWLRCFPRHIISQFHESTLHYTALRTSERPPSSHSPSPESPLVIAVDFLVETSVNAFIFLAHPVLCNIAVSLCLFVASNRCFASSNSVPGALAPRLLS
jgi:hypothetical protein